MVVGRLLLLLVVVAVVVIVVTLEMDYLVVPK